jgi:hypothetical protein
MSIALMGALTAKREDAPKAESTTTKAPGVKPYVDAFAGLVPAEVLAINAVILGFCTEVSKDKKTTNITEPGALKGAFVALIVLSVVLFLSSRFFAKDKTKKAPNRVVLALQCLVPPLAFVGWTMLQPVSVFDVIDIGLDVAERQVVAVIGAVFLGVAAVALGYRVDNEEPAPK